MSPDGVHRLEDLLALLPEQEFRELSKSLDCRETISGVRDSILGDGAGLEETISGLDSDSEAMLAGLVSVTPPPFEVDPAASTPALQSLKEHGLVFHLAIQVEPRLYVPLEVQVLLDSKQPQPDPDLRILLETYDSESLQGLEELYVDIESDDEGGAGWRWRICRLADSMERPVTLRQVFENLPETAREVLGWTCEHAGPISPDEVAELASDASRLHGERNGVAVGQLLRVGLLIAHELADGLDAYLVPRSLRPVILAFVDHTLTTQAHSGYQALISSGHLSFPDEGPHGWGGDTLKSFRQLAINWVSGQIEDLPAEFGVAVGLQILDPMHNEPASFASLLLDLSGETALSRQAIRLWLALGDDPWTIDLITRTGGNAEELSKYFSNSESVASEEDAEIWFGHLFLLRAQLLFVLSLLPPGRWYSIAEFADLYHLMAARTTFNNLHQGRFSARFPYEALPDYGVVLARPERQRAIQEWLESWLLELVAVIGAAEVEPSLTYFRVHPDAFCVFRDSDLWFRSLWDDMGAIVGDDIDLWMPIPNDPGARVKGVADVRTTGHRRITMDMDTHIHDLLRMARWARPVAEPAGYAFEFDQESISRALEAELDAEEMLTWLAIRIQGEIVPSLRSLFPISSSVVDGSETDWKLAAQRRVDNLLLSLESWGASPPSQLLEEIRSWSVAAVSPLLSLLESLIKQGKAEEPIVQHLCILLGELGAAKAADTVIDVLTNSGSEVMEHASAAACMRIGRPCLDNLATLLMSEANARGARLMAAMTITGLATPNPDTHREVGNLLISAIDANAFDTSFQTRLVLELCRMGHIKADGIVDELDGEGSWSNDDWRPEDAKWLARISPCVWGSLLFSLPISMLYLISEEADELAREAGVRELLRNAGLSSESLLYGRRRLTNDN